MLQFMTLHRKSNFSSFFGTLVLLSFFMFSEVLYSQNLAPSLPQRLGTVRATQAMHFGDVALRHASAFGTVTIDFNGVRTAGGDAILLNLGSVPRPAIFEFKVCPGRMVTFNYPATIQLTGQRGGTLQLNLGSTNRGPNGASFVSNLGCDDIHLIQLGGTIEIRNMASNPEGQYSGNLHITFIQQ